MKTNTTYSRVDEFEQHYIRLREQEGRLYTDEQLAMLPSIHKDHINYREWQIRKRSCMHLLRYIKQKSRIQSILEVGCGNGWLSGQLAKSTGATVLGTDINNTELEQASRVFKYPNLHFTNCDIRKHTGFENKFDLIVFAASIQYFSSLQEILEVAMELLTETGEIHIMDSHFYRPQDIEPARLRTQDYYARLAFDVLSNYYHHHSINNLSGFQYKVLHDPHSLKHTFSVSPNPFHWIVLKKQ